MENQTNNSVIPETNNVTGATKDESNQQSSPETITKTEQEEKQDHKEWPVLSIIATIIPIALWIYCFIASGGSTSENGPGVVWWLMIIYYWSLGLPLAGVSIAFGAMGLKTSLRWLSIISLLLKAAMIITIVLVIVCSLASIHH